MKLILFCIVLGLIPGYFIGQYNSIPECWKIVAERGILLEQERESKKLQIIKEQH
jgi:hypothetical protein